ncbi:hypothetical protein ACOSQ2_026951 [Xanthoceras sorbifolium]
MEFLVNTYGLFCITLVTKLLGRIYFHEDGPYTLGSFPDNVVAAVNGVALYGTLAGQLFVGWLGDKKGRKRAYSTTLMLVVICSIVFGFFFGKDLKATRGAFIADVFAMQGFGILAGGMVAIIAFATFNVKFQAQFMRLVAFDQLCLKLITFSV